MPAAPLDYTTFKQIKFDKQLPATLRYPHNIDTLFLLNETEYPLYAPLIKNLKAWDKQGTADSKGAAVFLLSYLHLSKKLAGQAPRSITKEEAAETYTYVYEYMMKHFNTTDLALGDIQKLVRGDKEWPLWGFPDLLSPQWTANYKDGKLKMISFFAKKARGMMVRYIIDTNAETIEDLKGFNYEGYQFDANLSKGNNLVFTR